MSSHERIIISRFRIFYRRRRKVIGRRWNAAARRQSKAARQRYLAHKEAARSIVHDRVRYFLGHYGPKHGIAIGKIAIRDQRSRWGSCSKRGNLNFNYRLAFLPAELQDYIVVHEICHIKEFNHGPDFWSLVRETVPGFNELRHKLRKLRIS